MFKNFFTDRKIRKQLKEEAIPTKSFEQFCNENGFEVSKNRQKVKSPKARYIKIFAPILTACVLCLCIVLPILSNLPSGGEEMREYGDMDINRIQLSALTEIDNHSELLLFRDDYVEDVDKITKILPNERQDLVLGYTISKIIYGFFIGDSLNAFEFDFVVRTYSKYNFAELSQYSGLEKGLDVSNNSCKYRFFSNSLGQYARIAFTHNNNDYYITLRSYEGITPINEETVEIFLTNILS